MSRADEDELNLGGFFFGNVNEEGLIDNEELDEEIKSALSMVTKKGAMPSLNLGLKIGIDKAVPTPTLPKTEPLPGEAVTAALESRQRPAPIGSNALCFTSLFHSAPTYGARRYVVRRLRIKRKKFGSRPLQLAEDQSGLFRKPSQVGGHPSNKLTTYQKILASVTGSKSKRFSARLERLRELGRLLGATVGSEPAAKKLDSQPVVATIVEKLHPVEVVEWEQNLIFGEQDAAEIVGKKPTYGPLYTNIYRVPPPELIRSHSGSTVATSASRLVSPLVSPNTSMSRVPNVVPLIPASRPTTPSTVQPPIKNSLAAKILNLDFENGTWERQIILDTKDLELYLPNTVLQWNQNDPHLFFEPTEEAVDLRKAKANKLTQKRPRKNRSAQVIREILRFDKPIADRFNLSNDKLYEVTTKESKTGALEGNKATGQSIRTIASRLGIHHAVPALKLSMPFYKTFWTKAELRGFHRPKLEYIAKSTIIFDQLTTEKTSTERKTSALTINSAKKLSLRDKASTPLILEYCEEIPPVMMNVGMGTSIVMYYRKQNPRDVPRIEPELGVLKVLEPTESSPFWIFGDIRPGSSMYIIQNNLFRAPLFEHPSLDTDFVALRYKVKGQLAPRYFLRPLPAKILTVGQLFPSMEVFGPHSRKHNIFCRNRIQAFAYRLFKKDQVAPETRPRLKISRIMAAFPQFSEGSLRKWLKEYADSVRTGQDSGTWRLRNDAPNLNEDDLRALVTPESICLYESMLAGQQRLNDAGLMDAQDMDGEEEFDLDNSAAEMKLAPWSLTANFISATLGKCTLQLRGLGDPSGRGEGFSFVKVPQKMAIGAKLSSLPEKSTATPGEDAAVAAAKKATKLSADQIAYRKEIAKIWEAQAKALSQPPSPLETEEDNSRDQFSIFESRPEARKKDVDEDGQSAVSGASRSSMSRGLNKTLVIKRSWNDEVTGLVREETETIDDTRLINAYLSQRRVWEGKRKRRLIAAAASAARAKKARINVADGSAAAAKLAHQQKTKPSKPKKEVLVRCGTCGEIGHMRTNRICPQYAVYEAESKRAQIDEPSAQPLGAPKISISKSLFASSQAQAVPTLKLRIAPSTATAQAGSATTKDPKGALLPKHPPQVAATIETFSKKLEKIVDELMAEPDSWPFHRPVSRQEYPQYFAIISTPLDLGTIRARARKLKYTEVSAFLADLQLVRDNCFRFNGADHPFSAIIDRLYQKGQLLCATEEVASLQSQIAQPPAAAEESEDALINIA